MQIIKSLFKILVFIFPTTVFAQSTFMHEGDEINHFIDRIEIKQQTNTDLNFSDVKPYNRKYIVRQATFIDSSRMGYMDSVGVDKYNDWYNQGFTDIDEYNLQQLLMKNSEWTSNAKDSNFLSRKPILKRFYKTKDNLFEIKNNNFFLAFNPVLQLYQGYDISAKNSISLNSRGVDLRGMIAKKIGFASTILTNQENGPNFFKNRIIKFNAVPGVGFYKPFKKSGVDYFDARGYITFKATDFIDIQFGYDKNFIGNGYRSLFLSDYGNSNLFLKVNTKIWKFNYQNLFMELMPQFYKTKDTLLDRKYAAIHHLSLNLTKWLNVGAFEGIIFGRKNHFDFQYLNPIIFYRHIEGSVGSPDNALAGFDFKANVAHRFQVYGQFLLDEFILSEMIKRSGFWGNKWGLQLGAKYVDAFGLDNLDIQVEMNSVRPFTYSHGDTIENYSHYNQPLAHPLGANFHEFIGVIKYQPANKWFINAQAIYYTQGLDSANGANYGSNIFRNSNTRSAEFGYFIGSGNKSTCLNSILEISYEWKPNLFLELTGQYRGFTVGGKATNNTTISLGVRLNMWKRKYDY